MKICTLKFAFNWNEPKMGFNQDFYHVVELSEPSNKLAVNSTVTFETVRKAGFIPQTAVATIALEPATA